METVLIFISEWKTVIILTFLTFAFYIRALCVKDEEYIYFFTNCTLVLFICVCFSVIERAHQKNMENIEDNYKSAKCFIYNGEVFDVDSINIKSELVYSGSRKFDLISVQLK